MLCNYSAIVMAEEKQNVFANYETCVNQYTKFCLKLFQINENLYVNISKSQQ